MFLQTIVGVEVIMKKFCTLLLVVLLGLCSFTACDIFNESDGDDTGAAGQGQSKDTSYDEEKEEGIMEDEDEAFELETKRVEETLLRWPLGRRRRES